MASTFFGLNIGKSGLYAYQAALNTTSHNISNAETKGYSRQVMTQQASKALKVNASYGMAGTGVDVMGIKQMRDEYYDIKYWKNTTLFGEYETKSYYMQNIETYFNEVSLDGFTTSFNSMFDSIQDLSKDPSSLTNRTQVVNFAKSFAEYFNATSESLLQVQREANFEIANQVDRVNSYAQQIASLTKQINTLEVNGTTANDLRDQRALLIDELSQIGSVTVKESIVGDGVGITSYLVRLDGQNLVDGQDYFTLKVVPREVKVNQSDAAGLYDIEWSNGQKFNPHSSSLSGSLKALFEVRDGNNNSSLVGKATIAKGTNIAQVTDTNMNQVEKMNMPPQGMIQIGDREYKYLGFKAIQDPATGKFSYEFELDSTVNDDINGEASIGRSINYKGVSYYLDELNSFIRTFAKSVNDLQRTGVDLNNNAGGDFFTGTDVQGRDYTFGPLKDSADLAGYNFNEFTTGTGQYAKDYKAGDPIYSSYYNLTASNFTISKEIESNVSRFVTATDVQNGIENNDIVAKLISLKDDKTMFNQGAPGSFLQTLVAEVGIDTKKAVNFALSQDNIINSITNQRLTISGVDTDEEAMNLVKFQNAYNLSAKVISVMDEIYNKLINEMGV